jgi:hypothetical protein
MEQPITVRIALIDMKTVPTRKLEIWSKLIEVQIYLNPVICRLEGSVTYNIFTSSNVASCNSKPKFHLNCCL